MSFLYRGTQTAHRAEAVAAQSRVEQFFPFLVGSAGSGAPQGMIGPLGCQGILLPHIQLAVYQNPQIPFHSTSCQPPVTQCFISVKDFISFFSLCVTYVFVFVVVVALFLDCIQIQYV